MYILDLLFSKLPLGVSCCVIAEHILLKGWEGPLIDSTNNLQASFITKILHLSSLIPPHSLQITQSSIAHGGLGLYRPSARDIPTSSSQWSKPSTMQPQESSFILRLQITSCQPTSLPCSTPPPTHHPSPSTASNMCCPPSPLLLRSLTTSPMNNASTTSSTACHPIVQGTTSASTLATPPPY